MAFMNNNIYCFVLKIHIISVIFIKNFILAPEVNLTTKASIEEKIVNVTKGTDISFNCEYENATPAGNQTIFNFNGKQTLKSKVSELSCMPLFDLKLKFGDIVILSTFVCLAFICSSVGHYTVKIVLILIGILELDRNYVVGN